MANQRWTQSKTSVYNVAYHLIWCPKYRKPILITPIDDRLKILLNEKAKTIGIKIDTMEIMPDHVHIFVKGKPIHAPHWIVQQLKGYTSRIMRKEFSILRKIPSLWTRSYYCESVGHISEDTIKKYIQNQKGK